MEGRPIELISKEEAKRKSSHDRTVRNTAPSHHTGTRRF
jgi:hypothetical protein